MYTKDIINLATKLYLVDVKRDGDDIKEAKKFVKTIRFRNTVNCTYTAMHRLDLAKEDNK